MNGKKLFGGFQAVKAEKAMATHSSTLTWKIPWVEEPGSYSPWGREESDTTEWLHFHFSLSCIGEGNGNPLQCSCLENPRDGRAWWAAISGVSQSQTQLKPLSSSSKQLRRDDVASGEEAGLELERPGVESLICHSLALFLSYLICKVKISTVFRIIGTRTRSLM